MGQWGVSAAASVSIDFGGIDASFWVVGFDIELLIGQSAQWSYKVQLVWHSVSSCGDLCFIGESYMEVLSVWTLCVSGNPICGDNTRGC